ncbi:MULTISPECIES: hypothetical protein [Yersinia]|uniref:hypothetical protein n=1 Tax=Yersinia TaxID=629 RepID=UPI00110E3129|nr:MULTISPECIES: hypothetical protein [Yersinia]QDW31672.1 hypothetical protein FFE93_000440 [Yersinia sp. KBS0713]
MKKTMSYGLIISMLALSTIAGASEILSYKNTIQPTVPLSSEKAGVKEMKVCGGGYVVQVWVSADAYKDWAVWLSPSGQSHSNTDKTLYWARSTGIGLDNEYGKAIYAAILSAQATGQLVNLLDDSSDACAIREMSNPIGEFSGKQFNSASNYYP